MILLIVGGCLHFHVQSTLNNVDVQHKALVTNSVNILLLNRFKFRQGRESRFCAKRKTSILRNTKRFCSKWLLQNIDTKVSNSNKCIRKGMKANVKSRRGGNKASLFILTYKGVLHSTDKKKKKEQDTPHERMFFLCTLITRRYTHL